MHPVLSAFIIWSVAVTAIIYANYIHHKRRKKVTTFQDSPDPEFWDNSALYNDPFLN